MENENTKPVLAELNYSISVDEYEKAFATIQKKYKYPKYIVYTVIVALVMAYNLYGVISGKMINPSTSWMVIAVSAAFIFAVWSNPVRIRKNLRAALEEIKDDNFVTEFYEDSVKISTVPTPEIIEQYGEIAPKVIFYETDQPHSIELTDLFIIYIRKQMYYTIPKRFLSQEQIETARNELSAKSAKFISDVK